jgi:adenosylmethionine-8-amino-7-oxononanoate aminotransferase
MIALCKQYGVLTIADEVMTGFGKTGTTFACEQLASPPDMMCLSKALTGGTIPMAVTTFTQEIFNGFWSDDVNKALFHGHTFTANPTGCAAALASLQLLQTEEMQNHCKRIHQRHLAFQELLRNHPKATNMRVKGVILAFEVKVAGQHDYYGPLRNQLYQFFIAEGIILRPVANTIYILPPYVIEDHQLEKIYQTVLKALEMV